MKRAPILLALFITLSARAASPDPKLYEEIRAVDQAMFAKFNAHDADGLLAYFDKDLEFFHDKDGLVSYDDCRRGFTNMFASATDIRRDLVEGSLEVYPIPNYGAMEIAAHRFCHTENGKADCGTFKFVHVWQKQESGWKLTRVVSYDHR